MNSTPVKKRHMNTIIKKSYREPSVKVLVLATENAVMTTSGYEDTFVNEVSTPLVDLGGFGGGSTNTPD